MLHTLKIIALLSTIHTPHVRQEVSRASANHYQIGHATLITNACTVTTDGLTARLDDGSRDGKPWVYFYDVAGEREADCEVLMIVTVTSKE